MWKILNLLLLLTGGILAAKEKSEVQRDTEFTLDFYKAYVNQFHTNDNVILSPLSIRAGMSMLYKVATSASVNEMKRVFRFSDDRDSAAQNHANFISSIISNPTIKVGAKVLATKEKTIKKDFENYVKNSHSSSFESVDFLKKAELVVNINDWVARATNNLIHDLLSEDAITPDTELILLNAIALEAKWKTEFSQFLTGKAPFTSNNKVYDVDMMQTDDLECRYGRDDKLKAEALELPYSDESDLVMLILLPYNGVPLEEVTRHLTLNKLNDIDASLSDMNVNVKLPRFKFESKINVLDILKKMGMQNFDVDIFTKSTSQIQKILQKAFIRVDEKGTAASAASATLIDIKYGGMDFIADYPFIFMIRKKSTKAIVFIGHCSMPNSAAK